MDNFVSVVGAMDKDKLIAGINANINYNLTAVFKF